MKTTKKKRIGGGAQLIIGVTLGVFAGTALHGTVLFTKNEPKENSVQAQNSNSCIVMKNPGDPCPSGSSSDFGTYCYADPMTACTCPNTSNGTCGAGSCMCPDQYCCETANGTCIQLPPYHPPQPGCVPQGNDPTTCQNNCGISSSSPVSTSSASSSSTNPPCGCYTPGGCNPMCDGNNGGGAPCTMPPGQTCADLCGPPTDCTSCPTNPMCPSSASNSSSSSSQRCCSGNVCS